MPRFLSAPKVGLLCLIELYTEDIVPSSSTVEILSFILKQLLPPIPATPSDSDASATQSADATDQDLPFVRDLKTFETLLSAHPAASGIPGRTLWDRFVTKLWRIDSLYAFQLFFVQSSNLLAKSREEIRSDAEMGIPPPSANTIYLSRASPLGIFVRRAKIEYVRLRFVFARSLWTEFVRWRYETRPYWARRSGMLNRFSGDQSLELGENEWGAEDTEMLELVVYEGFMSEMDGHGNISTNDADRLLEFQVERMQRLGDRIPVELKNKFRRVLDDGFRIPSLSHYLKFLDAWRSGDYTTSFDSLHRYFDYTMQSRDRLFYQYALMNMAVLQADFGCFDEAAAAMLETVYTARENKDMECLNFALNWLYQFGKAHPDVIRETNSTEMIGVEREGIAYLRTKAKETGMWTLWSSTLLSEAKLGMANGESVATALENLLRSSHLIACKNLKSMQGLQMAMASQLWARLGVAHLARRYSEVFLITHARDGIFDDTLKHTCRIAHLLTDTGRYDEAMKRFETLDENSLRSWKAYQYMLRYQGMLRLKRDLRHNNLDGADQLLTQLLQNNGDDVDPELQFEINDLHVDYLVRRTDFDAALTVLEKMAVASRKHGEDNHLRVRLLTLKALLQDKCGRPQKGFSVAMRAANIAWRGRLIPGLWAAMGAVANVLTSLSEFEASSDILVAVLPRALECQNSALTAQLYSFLVDAYMGQAGQAEDEDPTRREALTLCLEYIDRSFAEYSALEDVKGQCEMMAKKATVMKVLGDDAQANAYAGAYLDLKREAALACA